MIRIQTEPFDTAQLIHALQEASAGHTGALVSFTGYVRDYSPQHPTRSLFLEHYPGMCEREIADICSHAKVQWPITHAWVVHRVGELHSAEPIVFVGVTSPHRTEAFRACEFIMDALKTRAPFWKRETLANGERFWVEQKESDAQKTAAWGQTG